MPIEIKELHIQINVSDNAGNESQQPLSESEKNRIIETCVEQVMEIITKKEER